MVCNYSLKTAKWESAGLNFVRETHIFLIYQTPSKEAACEVHADDVVSNITAKPSRKKNKPKKLYQCVPCK